MAFLASWQGITKGYSTRPLFREITLGIEDGERMGLIGPNGSGKSTLLKILAGIEKPDAGEVSVRRGLRLAYVPQEDTFPAGQSVAQVLLEAQRGMPLDEHEKLIAVETMVGRCGFERADQAVETLSGGWKKRLALARELIRRPELLLLDEPTNHLDLEAILWLEGLLKNAPFAFVIVTHDRYFLQNVSTRIVELNAAYETGFLSVNGAYDDYVERRDSYLQGLAHTQMAMSNRLRRETEWLRASAPARSTKQNARIRQAGQLKADLAEVKYRGSQGQAAAIDFAATGRKTRDLLLAKGLAKSLGGKPLFSGLEVHLSPGTKLGLIGPNGSGKSSLIRVLTGEIEPDSGDIKRADGLRVVLFDQARKQLDRSWSLREALSPSGGDTVIYRDAPMHVAAWAKRFLFPSELLEMTVGYLSGGEQARILIARLMLEPADLLILDEPTNDLDIPTLQVLEESLAEFPGAMLLVTHDRYLLDAISTQVLSLDGVGGARYFADYHQWEAWRRQAIADRDRERVAASRPASAAPQRARLSTSEERELKKMEERIEKAEAEVAELQGRMAEPDIATDAAKLQDCWKRLQESQERVTALYTRWEELEARKNG